MKSRDWVITVGLGLTVLLLLVLSAIGRSTGTPSSTATPTTAGTRTPTGPPAPTTPAPVCTPPACQPDEKIICPGECPGGCGSVCATVTPESPSGAEAGQSIGLPVVESDSPSGGLEAGSPSAHPPHESEMITPEAGGSNIILLEGAKPSVPTNPCRDTQPTGRYYTVQPNDCLFRIGLAYDLRWTAIARANGLRAPYRIYAGQTLLIPGQ